MVAWDVHIDSSDCLMMSAQVHHPDLIAHAAGYIDRDNYVNPLGLDPDHTERFTEMSNSLFAWLPSQVEQLREVCSVQCWCLRC